MNDAGSALRAKTLYKKDADRWAYLRQYVTKSPCHKCYRDVACKVIPRPIPKIKYKGLANKTAPAATADLVQSLLAKRAAAYCVEVNGTYVEDNALQDNEDRGINADAENASDTYDECGRLPFNRRGRGPLAEGRKRVKLTRGVVQEDGSHYWL